MPNLLTLALLALLACFYLFVVVGAYVADMQLGRELRRSRLARARDTSYCAHHVTRADAARCNCRTMLGASLDAARAGRLTVAYRHACEATRLARVTQIHERAAIDAMMPMPMKAPKFTP